MKQRYQRWLLGLWLLLPLSVGATAVDGWVYPSDWSYQALQSLEKSGALTDMKGITLGTQPYPVEALLPLIQDVVQRRETMNQSDQMRAIRLYREFRDELIDYQREQDNTKKKGDA